MEPGSPWWRVAVSWSVCLLPFGVMLVMLILELFG